MNTTELKETKKYREMALALYTINKEAKKLRDEANSIERDIEEEVNLYGYDDEFPYWKKLKWVLQKKEKEIDDLFRDSSLDDHLTYCEKELAEFEKEADLEDEDDLEELENLKNKVEELEEEIEERDNEIKVLEKNLEDFYKKIDKVDEIRDKRDDLYQLKNKALYKIVSLLELSPVTYHQTGTSYYTQKICVYEDADGEEYENYTETTNYYRPLYSFAGLSFHGKSFKEDELPENINVDEIEELGEISAENKLEEKMELSLAMNILSDIFLEKTAAQGEG